MSTVESRWRGKLASRLTLLVRARARAAYWRVRKAAAKKGTKAYSHAAAMLADREKLVARRKAQVAYARRVLARHTKVSKTSSAGLAMVARFEGFRSKPYQDAVGVWTIGYGETRGVTAHTKPVSQKAALAALRRRIDADYLAPALRFCRSVGFEPNQHQADALASFAYNLGAGVFKRGTSIGDAIASHDRRRIASAIRLYDKAGGRVLPGLTARRKAEADLFLS